METEDRKKARAAALAMLLEQGRRVRRKYGNEPITVDGHTFDSKKEARRYGELRLLEQAGEIRDLRLQVPFQLQGQSGILKSDAGRTLTYVADFTYEVPGEDETPSRLVVEDTKGVRTGVYRLKKAILRSMGIEVLET